jgi:radical SAM superfamily enzyme YgiQ (UPF0313 family)
VKLCLISPKGGPKELPKAFVDIPEVIEYYRKKQETEDNFLGIWDGISCALPTIASVTPPIFDDIEIVDENVETLDLAKGYDLVAITSMTHQAIRAYEIAAECKSKNIPVVIGGIHPTVLPEEAKAYCDSVMSGEGEVIWPRLVNDFLNGALKPFYKSEDWVDLTQLPIPRYDLLASKNYRMIWIQTSRGCPHDCEFCIVNKVNGRKIRHKTNEQVVNEIKFIKEKVGNVEIGFSDENIFVDQKNSKLLLEQLIPLNIKWSAITDISIAENDELLELARQSGCKALLIGLESVCGKSLENLDPQNWKLRKLEKYPEYIKKIQATGISSMGSFMVGLDGDDITIFQQLIAFIKDNYLNSSSIAVIDAYPGTRLRERLLQENRVLPTNWDNYTKTGINIIPKNMNLPELATGLSICLDEIYNWEAILRMKKYYRELTKTLA